MSSTMCCNLLDLLIELYLKIIQEIIRNKHIDAHTGKQDKPIGISFDLVYWSSRYLCFCNLLALGIFKTVKLVNDKNNDSSLNVLAKSLHNIYVKELHFLDFSLKSIYSKEFIFSDIEETLASSVNELLCDLQQFPRLEKVSIEFKFNSLDLSWLDPLVKNLTYLVLIKNNSLYFKHSELRQFMLKEVSTLSHAAFHNLLGHLE